MNLEQKCEFLVDIAGKCEFGDEMSENADHWNNLGEMWRFVGETESTTKGFRLEWEKEVNRQYDWILKNLVRVQYQEPDPRTYTDIAHVDDVDQYEGCEELKITKLGT